MAKERIRKFETVVAALKAKRSLTDVQAAWMAHDVMRALFGCSDCDTREGQDRSQDRSYIIEFTREEAELLHALVTPLDAADSARQKFDVALDPARKPTFDELGYPRPPAGIVGWALDDDKGGS